jgi:hypothetical protein
MTKRLIGLSLLTAMAAVPTAQAQSLGERIEVGAFGQYTKLDDKVRIDNVAGVGARAGLSVYKWFGVEGDIQIGSTKATAITIMPFKAGPACARAQPSGVPGTLKCRM